MTRHIFLAVVLLGTAGLASGSGGQLAQVCLEDDATVIELALRHELEIDPALQPNKMLVLYEEVPQPNVMGGGQIRFGRSLLSRLLQRNPLGKKIPTLRLPRRVQLVPSIERARMFSETRGDDVWLKFYSLFPNAGGLINSSLPAFSANGDSSIVYLERKGGPLRAAGVLKQLKCRQGNWQVIRSQLLWAT